MLKSVNLITVTTVHLADPSAEKPANVRSVNPFNNWFTWCQSCRHGGHSNHVVDWFK